MRGRVLVDIPQYRARCGEIIEIPDADAVAFAALGMFEPIVEAPTERETAIVEAPEKRRGPGRPRRES